ncbi:MAG: hypothetical protein QOH55_1754 [Microbacteriaceae bacterium]|nr:hypothetical protein [Microbacteriaceae bacterium]
MTLPLKSLARGIWWLVVLRGILAIIFGIIALIAPAAALTGIAIVFGAYALVDGIMAIVHAVRTRKAAARWGWLLVQGVISLAAGLTALIFPGIAALFGGLFVIWTIVFYSVMHGAAGIASAAGAQTGRARTWGIAGGVLTLVFGVLLAILTFVTPGATILGLIWTVGIYAILFGVMLIIVGIQLRRGLVALGI